MTGGDGTELQAWSMPGYSLPIYPYRTPPELSGAPPGIYPVVIVGAGLSGLTLALELGQRGISTLLLDDDNTVGAAGISSRGICYARRSLEIFRKLGISHRIVEKGVLWRIGRVLRGADELYAFDLQKDARSEFPPFVNLQQFYVEEYLVDRIAEHPSVDLRWMTKVESVRQDDEFATVTVSTHEGQYDVKTRWLVAADGSQSVVRNSLDLTELPNFFGDLWCIVDVKTPLHLAAERRVWVTADFNDGGVVFFHRMADGVCRFDFQIGHYADPERHATAEEIMKRIRLALGADTKVDIVWAGVWQFKNRMMKRFRHGRSIFIGDAAHELPPFGARGGNGGIQDANNLGWKLAMVIAGEADQSLIDNYDEERRAAAVENIHQASRSALFLSPETEGGRLFRQAVCDLGPVAPHVRPMVNTGRLSVANSYPESQLAIADEDVFAAGPRPGAAMIDGPIAGAPEPHLIAAVSNDFFALHFVPDNAGSEWTVPMAYVGARKVPSRRILRSPTGARVGDWIDTSGFLTSSYDAEEGATYLFRPDGHVMKRSRSAQIRVDWPFGCLSPIAEGTA